MATGLILEGGAMRGIYTAGVLDEFMKEGITFPGVIGVSAGAVHGCSYVAGQRGRSIRYYLRYCGDKRFMICRSGWIPLTMKDFRNRGRISMWFVPMCGQGRRSIFFVRICGRTSII